MVERLKHGNRLSAASSEINSILCTARVMTTSDSYEELVLYSDCCFIIYILGFIKCRYSSFAM